MFAKNVLKKKQPSHEEFIKILDREVRFIRNLIIEKNEAYGNSALDPIRIFSKASTIEQLNVRIDDKLSRKAYGKEFCDEDTELDIIGYLILKRIARNEISS